MDLEKILQQALAEGVFLFVRDGRLGFKAKSGKISPELAKHVKANKDAVTAYLIAQQDKQTKPSDQLVALDDEKQVSASFAQQRFWFVDQFEGSSHHYNKQLLLQVDGQLNIAAMQQAFNTIVQRHQVIRTVLKEVDGQLIQQVNPACEVKIEQLDLCGQHNLSEQIKIFAEQQKNRNFDLTTDLMLRAQLLKTDVASFVLILTLHHIAFDAWADNILLQEFMQLYGAFAQGLASPLPPLPLQYRDFAHWQRQWVEQDGLQNAMSFWRNYLHDVPKLHALPLDGMRREGISLAGGVIKQQIDTDLTAHLRQFCREHQVTLFTLLHTVFALTVCRFSNSNELVTGSPIDTRHKGELASLVGFFLNSLVLRAKFEPEHRFIDTLNRAKQEILAAFSHQDVPFEKLVDELKPQRSLDYDPIFQIVFGLYNQQPKAVDTEGLKLQEIQPDTVLTVAELEVKISERENHLDIFWEYRKALFNRATIESLASCFVILLKQVIAKPEQKVFDYPLVDHQTEALVAQQALACAKLQPQVVIMHREFERLAQCQGQAKALIFGDQYLSYQQLNVKANRLAQCLLEQGIDAQERVGIFFASCPEMVIGILAVMKAGLIYVPLDVNHPKARIAAVLEQAQPEMVLTCSQYLQMMPSQSVDVFLLDDAFDDDWLDEYQSDDLLSNISADIEVYTLFTSGSTGTPKGVRVTHRGLSNYLSHGVSQYMRPYITGSVVSSSLSFDATMTTLLLPLLCGKSIELLPDDGMLIDALAARLLQHQQPLLFKLTTSHLQAVMQKPLAEPSDVRHLLVLGGEQLPTQVLLDWRHDYLTHATYVNEYGPTEAVVGVSTFFVEPDDGIDNNLDGWQQAPAVPIGRAIDHTQLLVLAQNGQLQPPYGIGELYIAGQSLALGYLADENQTLQKFVTHGWLDSAKMYRTGDLVRQLADGQFQFVGRQDRQVKVRGYRVELDEIEQRLALFDKLDNVAVTLHHKTDGTVQLVAYLVAKKSADLSDEQAHRQLSNDCREWVSRALPDYMAPNLYVVLPALPLSTNGKVDRHKLPEPEWQQTEALSFVAPQNELQSTMCQIWQQVLERESIGIKDNFFTIGGDSILSIKIVGLLHQHHIDIAVKDIFKHQTIEHLCAAIDSELQPVNKTDIQPFELLTDDEIATIDQTLVEDGYPLSVLQAGMVFHTQLADFDGVYHDINTDHIVCPWHETLFTQALNDCIAAHPILRSRYLLTAQRPLQLVYRQVDTPLVIDDIRHLSESEQASYVVSWQQTRRQYRFDFATDALYQINIFLRSDSCFAFALSFHHSVFDGWSRAQFTTSLYQRYQQLLSGERVLELAQESILREFIALEQQALTDDVARDYFAGLLLDAPSNQLPGVATLPMEQFVYASVEVKAFEQYSGALIGLAGDLGVPLQAVLQALHFKVLSTVSGLNKAMSNAVFNGRPETAGGEQGLGLFLNALPLVVSVADGSWRDLIEQIVLLNNDLIEHRHYPLATIIKDNDLTLDQVLFNYTHFHVFEQILASQQDNDLQLLASSEYEQTNYMLTVDIQRTSNDQSLVLHLRYNAALLSQANIEQMADYFIYAAEALLADVDSPCGRLSLLSNHEKAQLIDGFNQTRLPFPAQDCVHLAFERQVDKAPDALALEFESCTLSYHQLNQKANRLAHYLRSNCGVKPDSLVGICLQRSFDMVVALLAVLKAGGAYVPLDPDYPADRLAYMVTDAELKTVITSSMLTERITLPAQAYLCIDSEPVLSQLAQLPSGNLAVTDLALMPEHLAYVIYTSGSTGRPKGVMVPHRALVNRVDWMNNQYGSTPQDRILQKTPFSFDVSVWEFIWPLSVGASLVLAKPGGHKSPDYLTALIQSANISKLHFVPSMLSSLMAQQDLSDCNSLKQVFCSGEALPLSLVEQFIHRWPHIELHNLYGPTEAAIDVSYFACNDNIADRSMIPIGRPIQNIALYIVSEQGNLVPKGSVGELCIGGVGLARGYLNQPDLTEQRFIDNPFYLADGSRVSQRLYRTGDLARWSHDGEIEFLGRIDSQVKIRGFRIELQEIEQVLAAHQAVAEAVVLAKPLLSGDTGLVAYIVSSQQDGIVDSLKAYLSSQLPSHMMPSAFVLLDTLPVNANGKLERKALPQPDQWQLDKRRYVAPNTPQQQILCEIYAEVLGLQQVGIEDDFFDIGGHSLLAVRMVGLIRQRLDVELQLPKIFEFPTIIELSECIAQSAQTPVLPSIVAHSVTPSSFEQGEI